MKKVFKVFLLILSLIITNIVNAETNLTFDDDSPILDIYDSNYIIGDLGGINNFYLPSASTLGFKLYASGRKTSRIKKGKEIILEDIKPESIEINITSSSDIVCSITNARNDIYNLNGNTFSLINTGFDMAETMIGGISCTMPSTSEAIILSNDMWLNITISANNKDYVSGGVTNNLVTYRFNLGVINPAYLMSLNDSKEITSLTLDDKTVESNGKPFETKSATIKMNILRNSHKNKIVLKLYDSNAETLNKELTASEETLNLKYGTNYLKLFETTEKHLFIASLGTDYHYYGFNENDFRFNDYENTYTINRLDTRSKINTLKNLTISDININFSPDTKNYMATVPYKISQVKINATLMDDKSSYVSGYGTRTVDLAEGENEILIKVKAENGDINTYTIKITREKNNDASLSKLVINDKEIILKADLLTYSVILNNEIVIPNIKATPTDTNAKVTISEVKELKEGSNQVTITVKAANGDEVIYNIDIIRDTLVSINSKLKSITIKNHTFAFYPDVTDYTINIGKREKSLDIIVEPENAKATYKIINNENLKNKSVITIEVTAEDNKTKSIYKINIASSAKKLNPFLILAIVLAILLGVMIAKTIIKNKRKSWKNYERDD